MPPFATLEDVNRVLRYTTGDDETRDNRVRAALEAVDAWTQQLLPHVARSGPQIEVYFDVFEDGTLHLPQDVLTVTKVKIFSSPIQDSGTPFPPTEFNDVGGGYDLTDDGRLILRPSLFVTPMGFEGAVATRFLRKYERVEVHYLGSGIIPRNVVEGTAILAAGYYIEGPMILRGITMEKIGDYQYQRERATPGASGEDLSWEARAMWFLAPSLKAPRVTVV